MQVPFDLGQRPARTRTVLGAAGRYRRRAARGSRRSAAPAQHPSRTIGPVTLVERIGERGDLGRVEHGQLRQFGLRPADRPAPGSPSTTRIVDGLVVGGREDLPGFRDRRRRQVDGQLGDPAPNLASVAGLAERRNAPSGGTNVALDVALASRTDVDALVPDDPGDVVAARSRRRAPARPERRRRFPPARFVCCAASHSSASPITLLGTCSAPGVRRSASSSSKARLVAPAPVALSRSRTADGGRRCAFVCFVTFDPLGPGAVGVIRHRQVTRGTFPGTFPARSPTDLEPGRENPWSQGCTVGTSGASISAVPEPFHAGRGRTRSDVAGRHQRERRSFRPCPDDSGRFRDPPGTFPARPDTAGRDRIHPHSSRRGQTRRRRRPGALPLSGGEVDHSPGRRHWHSVAVGSSWRPVPQRSADETGRAPDRRARCTGRRRSGTGPVASSSRRRRVRHSNPCPVKRQPSGIRSHTSGTDRSSFRRRRPFGRSSAGSAPLSSPSPFPRTLPRPRSAGALRERSRALS